MPIFSWRGAAVAAWLFAQVTASTGAGPSVLSIDAAESRIVILVGKTGVLSIAGHAHEVVTQGVSGRITLDPANWMKGSVSLEFDASALRVTGKGESPADVPMVQRTMLSDKVLDVAHFPTIAFQSRRVSVTGSTAQPASVLIEGDMTLRGKTRPLSIRAAVSLDPGGRITARGSFTLKQTDFGMVPVTAVGGTVRVKDEVEIQFVLKANRIP